MRSTLFFFYMFLYGFPSFAQTVLTAVPFELRKPIERQQLLSGRDALQNNFYVFVSDKKQAVAMRFNQAIFLRDSLTAKRPPDEFSLSGYSIDETGIAYTYWTNPDFSKIQALGYDFKNRLTLSRTHTISYERETFISYFTDGAVYYILSVVDESQKIKIYRFKSGLAEIHEVDFSAYPIISHSGKNATLSDIFDRFPPEKMDADIPNPLFPASAKTKIYSEPNAIWIGFDHLSGATQLFKVSLSDFSVNEFKIPKPQLQDNAKGNSYLFRDTLYQLQANDHELAISATKIDSLQHAVVYRATFKDTISFKNSPLLIQTADRKPSVVKDSKRFLRRLADSRIAISVYDTGSGLLVTSGGVRQVADTGTIFLGATLGIGAIASGSSGSIGLAGDFFDPSLSQLVFFESIFDHDFKHMPKEQQPLAIDKLSGFLSENRNVNHYNLGAFNGFFILSYYDTKTKALVLRKFEDGSRF